MVKFTNPVLRLDLTDYPLGGSKRGECVFEAEYKKGKGWRVGRTTTGKTKYDTYSTKVAIVTGDDGRTYILRLNTEYGAMIDIRRSDFMTAGEEVTGKNGAIFPDDERYAELLALVEEAQPKS